ncbi:MAG TPA: OmpA family protein [Verrucomicrobiae bacterium]|nr:OmpA family protein [Verrucomicrobiae bacterium]
MKAIKFTSLLVIALVLTIGATGCKKKPVGMTPIPGKSYRPGDPGMAGIDDGNKINGASGGEAAFGGGPQSTIDPNNYNHDKEALRSHTIHFDYDSSVIRSSEKGNIEAVASYMKSAPAGVALLIEGNCDERGTEEYNRALGERRALAAREALVAEGVDAQKVVTKSYGKDNPVDSSNTDAGMARNRRDDFVVLHPK